MEYKLSEQAYVDFSSFLKQKLGIVLGCNRQYLVTSRLSILAREYEYCCFSTFLDDVIKGRDNTLTKRSLELMTTNETFWFRDDYPFYLLLNYVLPEISKQKKSIRIWSSACASGQEAYSIAMTILEFKKTNPMAFSQGVEIVGTDYSERMVSLASAGIYDELALGRGLLKDYREKYFRKLNFNLSATHNMEVAPEIKKLVRFKQLNLLGSFSTMGTFDVVFCRNVLIYFEQEQKVAVLKKIAACLPPNGSLFLGAAESISGVEHIYKMKTMSKGLYYTKV